MHRLFFGPYLLMIWQSETHYQNQNFYENCYQKNKCLTNTNIDFMGGDAYTWLISLMYVCLLFNHTYYGVINYIPITSSSGSTSYIILFLRFLFWQTNLLQVLLLQFIVR